MQPIETHYKGCRFRSRLEARWAVFLDQLGASWAYELEGFDLDGVWYLPDFWIRLNDGYRKPHPNGSPPESGFWLEIKPTEPDYATLEKCRRLSEKTQHCVYLAAGNIGLGEFYVWKWGPTSGLARSRQLSHIDLDADIDDSDDYWDILNFYLLEEASKGNFWSDYKNLKYAYDAARSARF